jgi:hypothetical protein
MVAIPALVVLNVFDLTRAYDCLDNAELGRVKREIGRLGPDDQATRQSLVCRELLQRELINSVEIFVDIL